MDKENVLLIRRGHAPLKGHWSIPGGALEVGETLEAGVIREAKEETGLEIRPLAIVEVFDRIYREAERVRYHYVLVDYVCTIESGILCCNSDADDARWVPVAELRNKDSWQLEEFTIEVIEKAAKIYRECAPHGNTQRLPSTSSGMRPRN